MYSILILGRNGIWGCVLLLTKQKKEYPHLLIKNPPPAMSEGGKSFLNIFVRI